MFCYECDARKRNIIDLSKHAQGHYESQESYFDHILE